jgi:hypothetical protein
MTASGLKEDQQDAAIVAVKRDIFAVVTAAVKEYPRGNHTTKKCRTVEVSKGDKPEWNEDLAFDELELVRVDLSRFD